MYQLSFNELHRWFICILRESEAKGYYRLDYFLLDYRKTFTTEMDNLELLVKLSDEFKTVLCIQDSMYSFDDIYGTLQMLYQKGGSYRHGVVEYLYVNEDYDIYHFEINNGTDSWMVIRERNLPIRLPECLTGVVSNIYEGYQWKTITTLP